ncbi:hypothetical protein ES703_99654 [subsurface metagenome]
MEDRLLMPALKLPVEPIAWGVVCWVRLSEVVPHLKETLVLEAVPRLVKLPCRVAELVVILSAAMVVTDGGSSPVVRLSIAP